MRRRRFCYGWLVGNQLFKLFQSLWAMHRHPVLAQRYVRNSRQTFSANANSPRWLWDYPWTPPYVRGHFHNSLPRCLVGLAVTGIAVMVIALAPSAVAHALERNFHRHSWLSNAAFACFLLIVVLVLVGYMTQSLFTILQRARFGDVRLRIDRFPIEPGSHFSAQLQFEPGAVYGPAAFRLRYIEAVNRVSQHKQGYDYVEFFTSECVAPLGAVVTFEVPARVNLARGRGTTSFLVPGEEQNPHYRGEFFWELEVEQCDVALPFFEHYCLPIYSSHPDAV